MNIDTLGFLHPLYYKEGKYILQIVNYHIQNKKI